MAFYERVNTKAPSSTFLSPPLDRSSYECGWNLVSSVTPIFCYVLLEYGSGAEGVALELPIVPPPHSRPALHGGIGARESTDVACPDACEKLEPRANNPLQRKEEGR